MRTYAKPFWFVIAIAFVGGFLVYESSGLFQAAPVTPSTAVATVNGDEILYRQWELLRQQLEQQQTNTSGRSLSLDEQNELANRAFDQLVDELLMQQEIRRRKIKVTDKDLQDAAKFSPPPQLMETPELQTDGQFDYEKYIRFMNSPAAKQGGMLLQLEQYYRNEIPKQVLYEQLAVGVYPSEGQLWTAFRDTRDSAQVTYAAFRPNPAPDAPVSDAEIKAYYDKNKKEFERPGRAQISFVYIPRLVSAADTQAVLTRATEIRARILAGSETFEDVARSESADPGSGANGGDLGKSAPGRFVAPFEAAVATLKPGEISQPVLTQFGYHLIRLDSRDRDSVALHHILLPIHQSEAAATAVDRKADSLSNLAGNAETAAKFDSAVKVLQLVPVKVDVTEGEPLIRDGKFVPSVAAWAFRGAKVGESSELFDAEDGYYLARLESIKQGGTAPLEDVRGDIRAQLAYDKAIEALVEPARKFAAAAAASSMEQAGQAQNVPLQQTPVFSRLSNVPGLGHTTSPIGAAFTLPIGAVSAPIKSVDGVFVIRVDRRIEAQRAAFDSTKTLIRDQQLRALQEGRIREYLAGLKQSAKIKDYRKEIQARLQRQPAG